jgi:hypothetical protein
LFRERVATQFSTCTMLDHLDDYPVLQAFAADSSLSGLYVDIAVYDFIRHANSTKGLNAQICRKDPTFLASLGFHLRKFSRPSSTGRNTLNHLLYFGRGSSIPTHCNRLIFSDAEYADFEAAREARRVT